jgi:hypothetical protein
MAGAFAEAGSISGTVRGPGGAGLEDIGVTAWREGSFFWFGTQTRTAGSGAYSFPDLEDGTYRIEFMDDWNDAYAHETYDNSPYLSGGRDVNVTAGSSTNIDVTLAYARVISGRILAPDGVTGLSNISVWAYLDEHALGWERKGGFGNSDANGEYVIGGLAACPYRVKAMDDEIGDYVSRVYPNASDLASGADVDLSASTNASNINITLPQAGKISGRVLTTNGIPLVDGAVDVRVWDGTRWGNADSSDGFLDDDGRYTVGGLSSGVYRVEFRIWDNNDILDEFYDNALEVEYGKDVTVVAGTTVSNINAVLDTPSWPPLIIRLTSMFSGREITYTAKDGKTCILQAVTSLGDEWSDITTNATYGTGIHTFFEHVPPDEHEYYWRIKSPTVP